MDGSAGTAAAAVTELVARPLHLAAVPAAGRRSCSRFGRVRRPPAVLERLPFVQGYGVDLGLLIDIAARFGIEAIAQVDLGVAASTATAPWTSCRPWPPGAPGGAAPATPGLAPERLVMTPPELDPVEITYRERPPLASLAEYRALHAD